MIRFRRKLLLIGVLAITFAGAILLYHFVEEPARRWMRRMVDISRLNADADDDPAAHTATGKLQSVDRALEARAKPRSRRARARNSTAGANAARHT